MNNSKHLDEGVYCCFKRFWFFGIAHRFLNLQNSPGRPALSETTVSETLVVRNAAVFKLNYRNLSKLIYSLCVYFSSKSRHRACSCKITNKSKINKVHIELGLEGANDSSLFSCVQALGKGVM